MTLEVWNPLDRTQLTTALFRTTGQTTVIGDFIRLTVDRIGMSKIRLSITAPRTLRILRDKLHVPDRLPREPLSHTTPLPRMTRLVVTLRSGGWVSIGDDVYVGVRRILEGRIILGFKNPPDLPIGDEGAWDDLDGPPQARVAMM